MDSLDSPTETTNLNNNQNKDQNYPIKKLLKKYWPKTLLELPKSQIPKQLRIRGQMPDWNQKRICVIGSRNFSDYGREVCRRIIADLANYPITIVSGLAYGIDSMSHQFAIANKLKTISIPGSGLCDDVIYPARHFSLAQKILETGNCLISEYDDKQPAQNWTFPQRNRIMAGISDLVLIIEATEESGTMITARLALDYNIDVACIPGSIFNKNSLGTNRLLKEGAQLIRNANDILEIFKIEINNQIDMKKKQEHIKEILKPTELKIFNLLKNSTTKQGLLQKSKLPIESLNQILSTLEIHSLINIIGDKINQK